MAANGSFSCSKIKRFRSFLRLTSRRPVAFVTIPAKTAHLRSRCVNRYTVSGLQVLEEVEYGFGRNVDAHEGPSLGLYAEYPGYACGRHSHRNGDLLRSKGERRAKERRGAAHHAYAAADVKSVFADCETAGTQCSQYQHRIDN